MIELKYTENKTCISGIGNFVIGDDIKNFVKNLGEYLNLEPSKKRVEKEIECCFDGDCRIKIKEFLVTQMNILENLIRIKDDTIKKDNTILDKINKKISLHFVKERKTSRTYITNLKNFLDNNELELLKKNLQKLLGSGSTINEDGDYGFNGDYTNDTDKKVIIKTCILKNSKINKDLFDF